MNLPTEEDVLAFLVLNAALGELSFFNSGDFAAIQAVISSWRASAEWSPGLEAVAHERLCAHDRVHSAAIADSERRLEAWEREQEVLGVLRSFEYPRGSEIRLLDQDPTPDEVLRWAWTTLGGHWRKVR